MSCSSDGTPPPPSSAKDIIVTTSRSCRVASPRASLRLSTQCINPSNDRARSPETTSAGGARGSFTVVPPGPPPTPPDISVASLSSPMYDNLIATLPCSKGGALARAGALAAAFSAAIVATAAAAVACAAAEAASAAFFSAATSLADSPASSATTGANTISNTPVSRSSPGVSAWQMYPIDCMTT
ncbi:hypothetical protein Vafri_8680 [Volvox africanus]|uniref:Uncharacterized protein n=1 Tax=Volvox africanus TaxID=51714 RepID=A0A8J4B4C5_9CHLO|nr:hypothetical protein Vafri_8680 [Volvox africanus]